MTIPTGSAPPAARCLERNGQREESSITPSTPPELLDHEPLDLAGRTEPVGQAPQPRFSAWWQT